MKTRSRYVIVGLGNPGKEYRDTRHNLGRMVVEKLAGHIGASFKKTALFDAQHAWYETGGNEIDCLLPETYMNDSGRAVAKFLRFFKLDPGCLIIVVDDMEIPFGTMRVRSKGSHGGHNGLKSIEAMLMTREYPRLRMGIGKSKSADIGYDGVVDHVLGRFSEEELKTLPSFVEKGVECLHKLINEV